MRGGLDDALHKLARRDELRRRAAGEVTTPPAVTELVESIAAVVARHPKLGVTVGVEGAGDPMLLHFYYADGVVQVTADRPPVDAAGEPAGPRHADIDIDLDLEEPDEEPYPTSPAADGQDGFDREGYGYADAGPTQRLYTWEASPQAYASPFAGPPQGSPDDEHGETTRLIRPLHYQAPAEAAATQRIPQQPAPGQASGPPSRLPKPVPLQVERPEETEMAARRVAALLRDDPSLLDRPE